VRFWCGILAPPEHRRSKGGMRGRPSLRQQQRCMHARLTILARRAGARGARTTGVLNARRPPGRSQPAMRRSAAPTSAK